MLKRVEKCEADITDRSSEHAFSECMLIAGHPGSHYDPRTECHWTDEDHFDGSGWSVECSECGEKMDQSDVCKHECKEE